jgi:hypothetical protein
MKNYNSIIAREFEDKGINYLINCHFISRCHKVNPINEYTNLLGKHVNAPGPDIKIETEKTRLIGEVKCVNQCYEGNNHQTVKKDILELINGKDSDKLKYDISSYVKFFVIKKINNIKEILINIANKNDINIEFLQDHRYRSLKFQDLSKDKIYIIILN